MGNSIDILTVAVFGHQIALITRLRSLMLKAGTQWDNHKFASQTETRCQFRLSCICSCRVHTWDTRSDPVSIWGIIVCSKPHERSGRAVFEAHSQCSGRPASTDGKLMMGWPKRATLKAT